VLEEAIEKAVLEDVDVHGAWECETGGSTHNWEVEIVELANEEDQFRSSGQYQATTYGPPRGIL
jgi:hypothetical protein